MTKPAVFTACFRSDLSVRPGTLFAFSARYRQSPGRCAPRRRCGDIGERAQRSRRPRSHAEKVKKVPGRTLREHLRWLVESAGPSTGLALLAALRVAAERLGQRPMIGRARPDLLPAPFRLWSIPRWHVLLVHDPSTQPPRVLRLLSTARDLPALLGDLNS